MDAQGDGGTAAFFLTEHVVELGFAEVHRGGGDLGEAVVGDGVADQRRGGIREWSWNLERVARDGGGWYFYAVTVGSPIF